MSDQRYESEPEESNPVDTALTAMDGVHSSVELAMNGGKTAADFAHETEEFYNGGGTAFERGMFGATPISAGLSLVGGLFDTSDGYRAYQRGDAAGAATGFTAGALDFTSAGAGVATLLGVPGAAMLGPAAAGTAVMLKEVHSGDRSVKERGWFHDEQGRDRGALEHLADTGTWVKDKFGGGTFGSIMGGATVLFGSPAAALTALSARGCDAADALGSAGTSFGGSLGHHARVAQYAGSDELQGITSLGQYDPATGAVSHAFRGTSEANETAGAISEYEDGMGAAATVGRHLTAPEWIKRVREISVGTSQEEQP